MSTEEVIMELKDSREFTFVDTHLNIVEESPTPAMSRIAGDFISSPSNNGTRQKRQAKTGSCEGANKCYVFAEFLLVLESMWPTFTYKHPCSYPNLLQTFMV